MKYPEILILALILIIPCTAQITFEKGYYIDNLDQKVECLIKNVNWKNNSSSIRIMLSENDAEKKLTIDDVKEFGVNQASKYVKQSVQIDRTSENPNQLSHLKKPIFQIEDLFLKVLVEGKANLYVYEDGNLRRFFYKVDDRTMEQLVFKTYRTPHYIKKNQAFRQQLLNYLKCDKISVDYINRIDYNAHELVEVFLKYNQCNSSESISYHNNDKKNNFYFSFRPGLSTSSINVERVGTGPEHPTNTTLGNTLSYRMGFESEFILTFRRNTWSFFVEPSIQFFSAESTKETNLISGGRSTATIHYNSIDIPIGIRHYLFLKNNNRFYLNIAHVYSLDLGSSIDYARTDGSIYQKLDFGTRFNYLYGVGFNKAGKYIVELRYQNRRNLLRSDSFWKVNFKSLTLIFGYRIGQQSL